MGAVDLMVNGFSFWAAFAAALERTMRPANFASLSFVMVGDDFQQKTAERV